MDRRSFLKGIAAGITAAYVPPLRAVDEFPVAETFIGEGWIIDANARTISLAPGVDQSFTVQELYTFLKEQWRENRELLIHPFPMMAITPDYAHLDNDWSVDAGSMTHMMGGCLQTCEGDKWASVVGLGNWDAADVRLHRDDLYYGEDVNPRGHIVRLTPEIAKLEWRDAVDSPIRNSINSRDHLGFEHMYRNCGGSIHYPMIPERLRL